MLPATAAPGSSNSRSQRSFLVEAKLSAIASPVGLACWRGLRCG
jgi:hypothetical protein